MIQAEQVVNCILEICEWAGRDNIQLWLPGLAEIALKGIDEGMRASLRDLYADILGVVQVVRVRTAET